MIPSELIHADENGDAVIGKNLKLEGGLVPVFTDRFELQDNEGIHKCTFIDYGEFKGAYFNILYFDYDDGSSQTMGLGFYSIDNNGVTRFDIYGVSTIDQEFQIVRLPNRNIGTTPTYTSIATRP